MTRRIEVPLAVLAGIVVRVPFWAEALRTPVDGDTAIVGLMARHPLASATMWGQPYGSPLEAWIAAPLFALLGADADTLRLVYFVLGLALIPAAYALASALDPRAALPAAFLVACPPPYLLLLSALPPPMYPSALLLAAGALLLAFAVRARREASRPEAALAAAWGVVAGLALWTHLMTLTVVAASGWHAFRGASRRTLGAALVALAVAGAPWGWTALGDPQGLRAVRVSARSETFAGHLAETLPRLHEPVGALLGTHTPVVADDPDHVVRTPGWASAALVLTYGLALIAAVRKSVAGRATPAGRRAALLLATAGLVLLAFPWPLRSGPASIRFLTPAFLPLAAVVAWLGLRPEGRRRAWLLVLGLATLHLVAATRLLSAWRTADRERAPFLLADLRPVRAHLEGHGIRRAYASYGPAYRLTFDTGERVIVSQPWNERFLHHPLPYLDEVRFAKNVAWILTPSVPTDLPAPRTFEEMLGRAGGAWRRTPAGASVVYDAFAPPFDPTVEPLPEAALRPDPRSALTLPLGAPRALDAITLFAASGGPRLLRNMDVEVSPDGSTFERVAARRRRDERDDLRWVNGHPQFVVDHDLLAIPLGGRTVSAVRVVPVASEDAYTLSEVLLHPARTPAERVPWDEWLDPNLTWDERRRALEVKPRRDREDWYYRSGLAARR
jgi:hypothetical protein